MALAFKSYLPKGFVQKNQAISNCNMLVCLRQFPSKLPVMPCYIKLCSKVVVLGLNSYTYSFFKMFIYLFMAALGLCCCTRAFSSCSDQGLLFVAVRGLLITVASLVVEHGL